MVSGSRPISSLSSYCEIILLNNLESLKNIFQLLSDQVQVELTIEKRVYEWVILKHEKWTSILRWTKASP